MPATEAATEAAIVAASAHRIEIVGERRPAYDAAFRARIIEASLAPGVRAQDLARRHDIHVSLIYRWRRLAKSSGTASTSIRSERANRIRSIETLGMEPPMAFIPVTVLGPLDDRCAASSERSAPLETAAQNEHPAGSGPKADGRTGRIEIDLPDGTRLRVDAAVDDQALRRVLVVLKGLP
jgi:transposase